MKKFNIFIFYFFIGTMNALLIQLFPLLFKYYEFNIETISLLISIGFVSVIFQPLIGYLTDRFTTKLTTIKILLILNAMAMVGLYFFQQLEFFVFFLVVASTSTKSLIPMIDGFVTKYEDHYAYSYGKMRTALPIGFGSSIFLILIFLEIFNLKINGILIFGIIISLLCLILVYYMKNFEKEDKTGQSSVISNNVEQSHYVNLLLLVAYFLLYAGLYQISNTYLTVYLIQSEYSYSYIAIINLLILIPQIYLLFNYQKHFEKFQLSTIMIFALLIGTLQTFIYAFFIDMGSLVLIVTMISGMQMVLFSASFFPSLSKNIKTKHVALGFMSASTLQIVWVGIFNQTVISHIQTLQNIYIVVCLVMLSALIPVIIYKIRNK